MMNESDELPRVKMTTTMRNTRKRLASAYQPRESWTFFSFRATATFLTPKAKTRHCQDSRNNAGEDDHLEGVALELCRTSLGQPNDQSSDSQPNKSTCSITSAVQTEG